MSREDSNKNKFDTLLDHEEYYLNFFGINLRVDKGVFSPDPNISHSTGIIEKYLESVKDKVVADIGTGTGALAILAASRGAAKVIATDTSKLAITNTKYNIKNSKLESHIEVVETSLLKGVNDKFDIIIANLPIAKELWEEEPLKIVEHFVGDLARNIKTSSRILLTWASFGENKEKLEEIFHRYGFKFELITETALGYDWYLYTLSLDQTLDFAGDATT